MYENLIFKEPFIIAEIGGNHEGNLNYAKKLLVDAASAGANAVKFQTYFPDKIVSKIENKERHAHFQKFVLSIEDYIELASLAKKNNILFMSSIWDIETLRELNPYIEIHKIGSGDLTNYPLIKAIIQTGKPFIFSTAMAQMSEIQETVEFINSIDSTYITLNKLSILQCVAMYGEPKNTYANLNVIKELRDSFPGIIIGYSDHTEGHYAANIAVALGANILELHFTDDKTREFRDHQISITKDELILLKANIAQTLSLLGAHSKAPVTEIETPSRIWEFRRACYLKVDCQKGDVMSIDNLTTLRPCSGIDARRYSDLIGKKLLVDKLAFHQLSWDDFE
jgi:N,N'-diacetyllegionaminate synthase